MQMHLGTDYAAGRAAVSGSRGLLPCKRQIVEQMFAFHCLLWYNNCKAVIIPILRPFSRRHRRQPKRWPLYHSTPRRGIITAKQLLYRFCGPFLAAKERQPKRWPLYHSTPRRGIITAKQLLYRFCGPFLAAKERQPKRWPLYHSTPRRGIITAKQLLYQFCGPFLAATGGNRKDGLFPWSPGP